MKRKTLPILLCFLVCLSLVGVGFAGWVITGSDEKTIEEGQIKVEAVTDNRYTIEGVGWKDSKSTIDFVCDTTGTSFENPWLTADPATSQNLSVTYQFKVKQGGEYLTSAGSNVTAKAELGEALNTAVTSGTLVALADDITLSNLTVSVSGEVFSVTLTFKWGSTFGNLNPYAYYNALEGTTANKDAAKTALTELYALNSQKITITITAE
ncbi:MAG: hypothetical protein ACI4U5_05095 [Bacilli bacterium]